MSLESDLATFSAQFKEKCPSKRAAVLRQAIAALMAELDRRDLPQAGDRAPDFTVYDKAGETVRLSERLARGPIILSFYRGGWCPYCTLELRAYQRLLPQLRALGADIIALSPQTPDRVREDAENNLLGYALASDPGAEVARAYRIDFQMDDGLRRLYSELGHPLPAFNGDKRWRLPVPATFVIMPDGRITLAYIDADHRKRLEPERALAALAP